MVSFVDRIFSTAGIFKSTCLLFLSPPLQWLLQHSCFLVSVDSCTHSSLFIMLTLCRNHKYLADLSKGEYEVTRMVRTLSFCLLAPNDHIPFNILEQILYTVIQSVKLVCPQHFQLVKVAFLKSLHYHRDGRYAVYLV